jgi:acyl-CoA thioesterase
MHIDNLLHLIKDSSTQGQNIENLKIGKDWTQGRTAYGGVSAALLYQAMQQVVGVNKQIRSLNTSYIGPIEADQGFRITTEVIREGKNVTQVIAKIIQGDNVAVLSQACFGTARVSKISVPASQPHGMNYPEKPDFMPVIPTVTPKFLKHYDLAQQKGGFPFTGKYGSEIHGWMRFNIAPKIFTQAHLVALIDMWPPAVLQLLREPAMASTVSWNLEFMHPQPEITGDHWVAYKAHTRQASDGYAHTEADIWDKNGVLLAISRQTVAVFD